MSNIDKTTVGSAEFASDKTTVGSAECSLFIPGVGTEETNRKEKKTTTHPFGQPFFPLPNYCMTWIFILPNPISKLYKYFTYLHIYYYTS
jgi:hypothetical protein